MYEGIKNQISNIRSKILKNEAFSGKEKMGSILDEVNVFVDLINEVESPKKNKKYNVRLLLDEIQDHYINLYNHLNYFKSHSDNKDVYLAGRFIMLNVLIPAVKWMAELRDKYEFAPVLEPIKDDFYPVFSKKVDFKINKMDIGQSSNTSVLTKLLQNEPDSEFKYDERQAIEAHLNKLEQKIIDIAYESTVDEFKECAGHISFQIEQYKKLTSNVSDEQLKSLTSEVEGYIKLVEAFLAVINELINDSSAVLILKTHLNAIDDKKETWNIDKMFVKLFEKIPSSNLIKKQYENLNELARNNLPKEVLENANKIMTADLPENQENKSNPKMVGKKSF